MLQDFCIKALALPLCVACICGIPGLAAAAPFAYVVQGPEDIRLEDPSIVVPIIDTATNTRVGSIPVANTPENFFRPLAIAFAPDAKLGYVAGSNSRNTPDLRGQVRIIDTGTNQFLPATIDLPGTAPNQNQALLVEVTPDGRFVYVVSQEGPDVAFDATIYRVWQINAATRTILRSFALDPGLGAVQAIHMARSGKLYVSTWVPSTRGAVLVVDTATNTISGAPIELGTFAGAMTTTPDGTKLYVNSVPAMAIVDTATRAVIGNVATPQPQPPVFSCGGGGMEIAPDGKFLWVVTGGSSATLHRIDTASNTCTGIFPSVGDTGTDLVIRPDGKFIYHISGGRRASSLGIIDAANPAAQPIPIIGLGREARQIAIAAPLPAPRAFPRTSVLDNFNRANGALGGRWSGADAAGYRILAQQADVQSGGRAYWQAQNFGVNQEAFMRLAKIDADSQTQGLTLKVQGGSATVQPDITLGAIEVRYNAVGGTVHVVTYLPRATRATIYPAITQRFAAGDQLGARVRANGTVEIYRNGTRIGTRTLSSADQAFFNHNGGRIGLRFNTTADDAVVDDFGGGNAP
jgi:DNA-binding beta-propeller fold protein YncE